MLAAHSDLTYFVSRAAHVYTGQWPGESHLQLGVGRLAGRGGHLDKFADTVAIQHLHTRCFVSELVGRALHRTPCPDLEGVVLQEAG